MRRSRPQPASGFAAEATRNCYGHGYEPTPGVHLPARHRNRLARLPVLHGDPLPGQEGRQKW